MAVTVHSPDDLEKFPPRDLKVGLVRSGGGGELRGIVFGISGQLHLAGQVGNRPLRGARQRQTPVRPLQTSAPPAQGVF